MENPVARIEDLLKEQSGDSVGRRKDERYPCLLAGVIIADRGSMECEILSLSNGGLSARCFGMVEKGQTVQVKTPKDYPGSDGRPLQCEVTWASKASAGMMARFAVSETETLENSWLAAEIEELKARARDSRQRRGGVRVKCQIPAELSWDGESREALLHDLGTIGARVECAEGPPPEQPFVLRFGPIAHLPKMVVSAKLATTHDPHGKVYGVAFTSLQNGGHKDLLGYMNHAFAPKKS